MSNPYLLPKGPPTREERLARIERRMGGLMQDTKVASSKFQELPESASFLSVRKADLWYPAAALNLDFTMSSFTPGANTIFLVPLYVPSRPSVLDGIGVSVTVGGGLAHAGIYDDNGDVSPGDLIEDLGEFAVSTTGFKSVTGRRVTLKRGLKWVAFLCNSGALQIRTINTRYWAVLGVDTTTPTTGYGAYSTPQAYGALPGHLGDSVVLTKLSYVPLMLVRFAETPYS